jgi:hypothetical protein
MVALFRQHDEKKTHTEGFVESALSPPRPSKPKHAPATSTMKQTSNVPIEARKSDTDNHKNEDTRPVFMRSWYLQTCSIFPAAKARKKGFDPARSRLQFSFSDDGRSLRPCGCRAATAALHGMWTLQTRSWWFSAMRVSSYFWMELEAEGPHGWLGKEGTILWCEICRWRPNGC